MTFTTPVFLVFLTIVFALYWALDRRRQNWLILVASLVFYGWWDWRFLFLLLFTAGIDYLAALGMRKTTDARRRRFLLGVSLVSNLGALGFFKYYNFFADSLHWALRKAGIDLDPWTLRIILPVGLSFYTFQALSYTIDVYRGRLEAVRDFAAYFCFISFFPHMVAGPIQQATHLLVQFEKDRRFDWDVAADGARQMLWGFFKKMVVADNLAPLVQAAYGDVDAASGGQLLWATYFFAFQIYCDFSGYTDIAIGCAKLFDFHMTRNFAYPYFSRTIPEFWRRWHISLSTWFREYLYIPLGGNRHGNRRRLLNVLIVFVVSGFWHGANWTFVIWGLLHGLFYVAYDLLGLNRPESDKAPGGPGLIPSLRSVGAMLLTFHLALVAWVFFRAASATEALTILTKITSAAMSATFTAPNRMAALWIGVLLAAEWVQRRYAHALKIEGVPRPLRWAAYYATAVAILLFAGLNYVPFIYFQF